jgi:hypothetical protein
MTNEQKTNLNASNLCPLASWLLLFTLALPGQLPGMVFIRLSSAIAPASVAGFCDSNSIAKNYLRFSSTAAYIEPPA